MKKIYQITQRLFLFAVAMLLIGSAYGQITISGTVLDGKFGGGLPGANVTVKGTTNGTITDFDGKYTITVDDESAVLVFSFIGYENIEKTVGTQRSFEVTLNENVKQLKEVVKIGYGVAKKEDITSAIVSVKGEDIADKPVLSADQALQGRAAGVQVKVNSGSPGGDMLVNIRGVSSLGDSKPLYVVDGVPQEDIKGINPGDIKDMAILKDASACAIYGSRAAYGVIIITTKDGGKATKEEVSAIEFTGYRGIQSAWKRVDIMTNEEFMEYRNSFGSTEGYYTDRVRDSIGAGVDWQDELFRKAIIESYQLSFAGASSKTSYSVSGSYYNQEGIIIGSDYKRYTARMKATHKLKPRLLVGESVGFSVVKQHEIDEGSMYNNVLTNALMMRPDEISVYDTTSNTDVPIYYRGKTGKNPVGLIESKPNESNNFGMGGWIFAEYEVIEGLKLKTQGSYGLYYNVKDEFGKQFKVTTEFGRDPNYFQKQIREGFNWNLTNTATYAKSIYSKKEDGSYDSSEVKHAFSAMIGTEANYKFDNGQVVQANGMASEIEEQWYFSVPSSSVQVFQDKSNGNMPQEIAIGSYLGRVEYGYASRYNVNATVRRDGSSKFGSEYRWGWFPSVGAAWKIHEESFFKNQESIKFINTCKLRLGWGMIGNQSTAGPYDWAGSTMSELNGYVVNGERVTGLSSETPPNPYLKWEASETYNVGLDLAFLRNKITFSTDFYIKNTNDMIASIPVPTVVGLNKSPNVNSAKMRNTGADFSLLYRKGEGEFKYSVAGNVSTYKNEVVDLGKNSDGTEVTIPGGYLSSHEMYSNLTREGHSVGDFYGYKFDGVYQSWEEINSGPKPKGGFAEPGDARFADLNGDGKITSEDQTFIGSPHPDFIYGFNFDASYKGFDFSVALSGSKGNENVNGMKYFIDGDLAGNNLHSRRLDAWTPENPSNEQPKASEDSRAYLDMSDLYIEDASYMRLQSVQLGYTLPDAFCRKIKISKMRVYIQGQNLLTFTKYSGFDPEVGVDNTAGFNTEGAKGPEVGIDRGVYPVAKTYLAGLSFTF